MIIYTDTREQRPLKFKPESWFTSESKCLAVADYACLLDDGTTCPVRFERKSKGDLWGTMVPNKTDPDCYKRFKREMKRAEQMEIGMIIIVEASFHDVASGYKYSRFTGRAMIRKCNTLHLRYPNVIIYPVVFTNSRAESAAYIKSYYEGFNKDLKHKGGE